jgi:hypothetical protein
VADEHGNYDPLTDLGPLLAAVLNYDMTSAAHYAGRLGLRLGITGDDSAETVTGKLRKALGLDAAHGILGDPARVKVTVTDLDTGDSESEVVADDYFMTCAGSCYVDHVQVYANGTHVITVKGRGRRNGAPGKARDAR